MFTLFDTIHEHDRHPDGEINRHTARRYRPHLCIASCGNNNKKLSCRRETARRFMSLNIVPSQSGSLKVIRNDAVE